MPWKRIFEWWPIYKQYEGEEELKKLYDIISMPENVEKMINANDNMDKPPVVGLQNIIEEGDGAGILSGFDIGENKTLRRLIGSMIGEIIYDYGYRPYKHKNISGGSKYFKSATHYKYVEGAASKKLQKGITIETSGLNEPETTRQDDNIKNIEYIEKSKAFRKYFEKYGLEDKIRELFLSLNVPGESLAHGDPSMAHYLECSAFEASIFPFAEQFGRYSSGMYLNIFQIASLLEYKYPGIIELSGITVNYSRNSSVLLSGSDFFTMLTERLTEDAKDEPSLFEAAYLSKSSIDSFTVVINGLNHCSYNARKDMPIFRLRNRLDIVKDLALKERFGGYFNEISEEFFKVNDVMAFIIKILKKNTKAGTGDLDVYFSLPQIIAELSMKNPIKSRYYPFTCVFFEVMKRIFRGELPEIDLAIWPGNGIAQFLYSIKFKDDAVLMDGTANYIPLLAYRR